MSLKDTFKEEKEKMAAMNRRDKIWYIAAYYKFHLAALALAICFLVGAGQIIYRNTFTTRLYTLIINDRTDGACGQELEALLKEARAYTKKDVLEIDDGLKLDAGAEQMSEYAYANMAKLAALFASQSVDLFISDEKTLEYYGKQGAFLSLDELLDEETLNRTGAEKDALTQTGDDGSSEIFALPLENSTLAHDRGLDLSGVYVAVIANAPHKEEAAQSLLILFP